MMPILHSPGVMIPGQLGPMSRVSLPVRARFTFTMSSTGMPSVMQMTSGIFAATASRMASAAKGGGTKMTLAFAPVSATAFETVSNTGTLSRNRPPPFPGVTPATRFVPYSSICPEWKDPALPVMPWQRTRVDLFTRMLMAVQPLPLMLRSSSTTACASSVSAR